MNKLLKILLALAMLLSLQRLSAQYYTWGADPVGLKWKTIRSDNVQLIYPDTARGFALRTLHSIEQIKPVIDHGFRHPALSIPFVMHPENFESNGLVMWLPKRIEFLTSPAIESYSMPWYKQLAAHEYRHAVQYNNLNRGVIRGLSYLLGQQGSTVGLLFLPIWLIEGDAVVAETEFSSFGRGLQPRFTLEYRALGREVLRRRNLDKWFCGSYLDNIPDHYRLGYQIASYAWWRYDENIWDKVAWYSVRNPYLFFTVSKSLKKFYGTSVNRLFRESFTRLNDHWEALPAVEPTSVPLHELPRRNYTSYQWPVAESDSTLIALKSALNRPSRFVRVDLHTGREQKMPYTGLLSTRPALDQEGRLWWTEYRRSLLFEQRVGSQLCYLDAGSNRPRTLKGVRNALYATPFAEGLAWVEYRPEGRYALVIRTAQGTERRVEVPYFNEVHGLAWEELTQRFYLLITNDDGMSIVRLEGEEFQPVKRSAYITLSDLRAADGRLYFGSIQSGRDEVHCLDLRTGSEYQLTHSTHGSFAPAPVNADRLVVSDYARQGYRLARQAVDTLHRVPYAMLPDGSLNPPRKSWGLLNLDTVRFTPADSARMLQQTPARKYRKGLHLFKIHSWAPVAYNPFDLVDEHNVDFNWGATLLSQNLLSNTEAFFSWGWNRAEGSVLRMGVRYLGLGPTIHIDGAWGGNQLIYSLMQYNPETEAPEYQKSPSPDRYYSLGASVTLPLYFQRGYHTRQLTFSAGWNYSNGLVANLGQIRYDEQTHSITNIENIGFRKGLHKISFGAGFSNVVRTAPREFAPRWGYLFQADYAFNPENGAFSDLISLFGRFYLPGVTRPHSLLVEATYQTSLGGFKTPDGLRLLTYKSTRLIPKGYSSDAILNDNYSAFRVNYQLPLWYPEGGIPSVLYIKRIRLNLGVDYARFHRGHAWRHLTSYGGDLLFDLNIFRQPDSATSTLKLSFYQPRHGSFWFGASVGLPF